MRLNLLIALPAFIVWSMALVKQPLWVRDFGFAFCLWAVTTLVWCVIKDLEA